MEMQYVVYWMTRASTLITVIGPALAFATGLLLVPAWRPMARRLALIAIVASPGSHLLSYWTAEGLHVVPLHLAAYFWLLVSARLDLRRDWFGCVAGGWLGTLAADMLGTWTAWGTRAYTAPHWTWGIGGYGALDALIVYPVAFTALLLGARLALDGRWFDPATWMVRLAALRG